MQKKKKKIVLVLHNAYAQMLYKVVYKILH